MKTPWDYRIILNENQEKILKNAMALLKKHISNEPCGEIHYITVDGDDMGSEYQTCNNSACIELMKQEALTNFKKNDISVEVVTNNSDFENLETCQVCNNPLNEWLTWISNDFYYHIEHATNNEEIINHAFEIHTIFKSFPSNDREISAYAIHQFNLGNKSPLNNQIKQRDDFTKEVIKYAELVFNKLSKNVEQ